MKRPHTPEPVQHSYIRAVDGGNADLFCLADYPITAVCKLCKEPITAATFLAKFKHKTPAGDAVVRALRPDQDSL